MFILFTDIKCFQVKQVSIQSLWSYIDVFSKFLKSHSAPLISFEVLRSVKIPHACDSGVSSIFFGSHKSAGHSSLVHLGLRSHREDSRAERAAVYESAV